MMPRGGNADDDSAVLLRARRFVAHRMLMKGLVYQVQQSPVSTAVSGDFYRTGVFYRSASRAVVLSLQSGSSTTTISSATTNQSIFTHIRTRDDGPSKSSFLRSMHGRYSTVRDGISATCEESTSYSYPLIVAQVQGVVPCNLLRGYSRVSALMIGLPEFTAPGY